MGKTIYQIDKDESLLFSQSRKSIKLRKSIFKWLAKRQNNNFNLICNDKVIELYNSYKDIKRLNNINEYIERSMITIFSKIYLEYINDIKPHYKTMCGIRLLTKKMIDVATHPDLYENQLFNIAITFTRVRGHDEIEFYKDCYLHDKVFYKTLEDNGESLYHLTCDANTISMFFKNNRNIIKLMFEDDLDVIFKKTNKRSITR